MVIFQENVSFDHYFGTYPYAANTDGTTFHAKQGTPPVNGLYTKITERPGRPAAHEQPEPLQPHAAFPLQALTCDQDHGYTPEQNAVNGGR